MHLSDQEAVAATLKDRHAFSVLVERYQAPLLRYTRRLGMLDIENAKDVLQEAFIKAYLNLNDYDPSLPFSSWLYRIVHNETMMHFRRAKSRPHVVEDEAALALFAIAPDELDMVEESDTMLRGERIARALGALAPMYRDVLILRFYEQKSYNEISDILHIPLGTVATYLSRGKAALEKLLAGEHITDLYYGDRE